MAKYPELNTAVHYVISRCRPDDLGATKLNKVLWFADISFYERFGRSITGDSYVKLQYGPVPKHAPMATRELEEIGAIVSRSVEYFGKIKREFWAILEPDISDFSPEAISIIDQMIEWICHNHTASSISEKTHDLLWESAEIGEEIPLAAALAIRSAEITEDDVVWARSELALAS